MAQQTSQINIAFLTKGEGEVAKAFKRLRGETTRLNRDFKSLSKDSIAKVKNEFNKLGAGARNSLNAMQAQRNALNGLRNMADVTSIEFKQLTADIARLDAQMRKAGAGTTGFKNKLKGIAKGAGAVAAGGIFGGVEGAAGAGIGLAVGGAPGAAIGAAVGAQVGMVRQSIGAVADYDAALELQRKALKLVIGDTKEYAKSQEFLADRSKKLAIPQDVIVRQFTSLTASVKGAGKETADAEKVFKAIAAGIRGTGGNLEDMKAAMRATSQVFSKGKVSAEELRQQLGERLPGAFTLFADSMDKTPAELDKALEQGKVTLDDFMKFAEKLFDTYGENAEILAASPEAAGDRLRTEMSNLKDSLGDILRPMGAAFQTFAAEAVGAFNQVIKRVKKFQIEMKQEGLRKTIEEADRQIKNIDARLKVLAKQDTKNANQLRRELIQNRATQIGIKSSAQSDLRSQFIPKDFTVNGNVYDGLTGQFKGTVEELNKSTKKQTTEDLNNIQKGAKAYFDTIKDFGKQTQDAVSNAFKGMEDALVRFVETGKLNFNDLARSILSDLTRITVRAALLNFLSPFKFFDRVTGGSGGGDGATNANGNVFAKNGVVPYRKGGIVDSPTYFQYGGSNLGIMGEAGAESIMPLKRGKDGKLGVIAHGGGSTVVNVSVNADGSSVQGQEDESRQLGEVIAAAIQQQIIMEQRPGGLLHG